MSMSAPNVSSWDLAEVGYPEVESSALLQAHLPNAGFDIDPGVAGLPTAFVASWGSGSPVIGILAEFDALPGITQDRSPERTPRPEMGRGSRLRAPPLRRGKAGIAMVREARGNPVEEPGGTVRLAPSPSR